ncbi:hypothetical protein [Streptomyces sp. NRRL S-337]|uniref:hypothetical protein n=1 Tax=Streptomyces sp. NRRL S-337 TaxID=1463900 RepID=UPI00099CCDA2
MRDGIRSREVGGGGHDGGHDGDRAGWFLREVTSGDAQVMARWRGNYRRGNERSARRHPRHATGR